jgi:hypothetical protein
MFIPFELPPPLGNNHVAIPNIVAPTLPLSPPNPPLRSTSPTAEIPSGEPEDWWPLETIHSGVQQEPNRRSSFGCVDEQELCGSLVTAHDVSVHEHNITMLKNMMFAVAAFSAVYCVMKFIYVLHKRNFVQTSFQKSRVGEAATSTARSQKSRAKKRAEKEGRRCTHCNGTGFLDDGMMQGVAGQPGLSTGDQGAGQTAPSTGDQGAARTAPSTGDQGAGQTAPSTGDQGAARTAPSTGDQGAARTAPSTGEQSAGQPVGPVAVGKQTGPMMAPAHMIVDEVLRTLKHQKRIDLLSLRDKSARRQRKQMVLLASRLAAAVRSGKKPHEVEDEDVLELIFFLLGEVAAKPADTIRKYFCRNECARDSIYLDLKKKIQGCFTPELFAGLRIM